MGIGGDARGSCWMGGLTCKCDENFRSKRTGVTKWGLLLRKTCLGEIFFKFSFFQRKDEVYT